jgi:hypothetical protein
MRRGRSRLPPVTRGARCGAMPWVTCRRDEETCGTATASHPSVLYFECRQDTLAERLSSARSRLGMCSGGLTSPSDLLEELAAGELLVVGEDGGADQDALQDFVVVQGWRSGDIQRVGVLWGGPGVEGQPFPGRFRPFDTIGACRGSVKGRPRISPCASPSSSSPQ